MVQLPAETPRFRWLWLTSIWFALGLFDATQTVVSMRAEGMHHAWIKLFVTLLLSWMPLVLATPLVMDLGRRYPTFGAGCFRHWLLHLGACATLCLAAGAFIAVLEKLLNPWARPSGSGPFLRLWLLKFAGSIVAYVIFYGSILAIGYVLDSQERLAAQQTETARLNEQLSKAHLDALRRQLEPHFLFNALHAIAGLVREKRPDDAVSMIAGLSDFLRHVVQDSNRHEVPLRQEMAYLQKYLDIQKIRFGNRLHVCVEVPAELLSATVPSLLLQPIVENAIKHGVAKLAQGGGIRISAYRLDGKLRLQVYNDGPSLPTNWRESQMGVGISNLQTRLRGLYGEGFQLNLCNQESGGVQTVISLPYKES